MISISSRFPSLSLSMVRPIPNSQFSPGSHAHGRGLPSLTHSGTHTSHIRSPPPLSSRDLRVAPIRMRRYTSSHSRSTTGSTFLAQSRGGTFGNRCYRRGRILPFPSINRRRAIRASESGSSIITLQQRYGPATGERGRSPELRTLQLVSRPPHRRHHHRIARDSTNLDLRLATPIPLTLDLNDVERP
jgi:hypothetical protein